MKTPMHIKQLTIQNYRNFGEPPFTTELKPFTLVLGENNVGKTNLLNALGLIFSQEIMIFRKRVLEIDDINYARVKLFKREILDLNTTAEDVKFPVVCIEVELVGMDEDQERVVGDWFVDKELTQAKITYRFEPQISFDRTAWVKRERERLAARDSPGTEMVDFPIGEYRYSLFGGGDPTNRCDLYFLKMLRMEFLDALRDAQRELIASSDYRLLYRILSQEDAADYGDIKDELRQLEVKVRENRRLEEIQEQIVGLLSKLSLQSSEDENKVGFSFSSPETTEVLKKLGLVYGSDPISVARNGLGRNNLLYMSLILSTLAEKDARGGSNSFRLIGVEEPEAHLHPHLQDHLAANLVGILDESKSMQLLLTSHSTDIAAKLDLKNTCVLYKDQGGSLRTHYILSGLDEGKAEQKASARYLAKHIDATKSRMFFARRIILVEGVAEQLLVPRLFQLHVGATLEQRGCNVVNVNGVAFKHFLRIIKAGFFIRCLVLTDSDLSTRSRERARKLKKSFDEEGLIRVEVSKKSTFEKDLVAANTSGTGRSILLDALKKTRPSSGKEYEVGLGEADIDVDSFFGEVDKYKSEFAFNLLSQLEVRSIVLPNYIRRGFEFLEEKWICPSKSSQPSS